MNGAVVIRWGPAVPGRESKGLEVFSKALGYYEHLAKSGRIHGHREYFSLTGTGGGIMVVEGFVDELLKIQAEPESIKLRMQAAATVSDFTTDVFVGGSDSAVQHSVVNYTESLSELGYL